MKRGSLRQRLALQWVVLALLLALALFFAVRLTAERASRAASDAVLQAAARAISDSVRAQDEGLEIDLPYASFSMLGAMGSERVFYRIALDGMPVTGYDDLPLPPDPDLGAPQLYSALYRDADLRLAALSRNLLVEGRSQQLSVILGQTRQGQAQIARTTARNAAAVGLGFLALSLPLALWAGAAALRPVERLAEAVRRRGPHDLRPVRHPAPRELDPLVTALNGLIARLRATLLGAEQFIHEAAHRIRTPLSLVRTEAEIALRHAETDAARDRLRRMLRAIEETSRSANQILDHAMVLYRAEHPENLPLDLARLTAGVVAGCEAVAEMRDIDISAHGLDAPVMMRGDARMIEVALRNLLDNAVKYSHPEGRVRLRLSVAGGMAVIALRDQGRGLAGGGIGSPFQRGDNVGDVVGSGLGLAIVEEVARTHQGSFSLTATTEGTCARFSLPL
ncbi:MAG: sensor histidine kinase [Paracoccus sp. (in: a-proteobacteria)]|nr:sensor histidine kinase [Paracoccus sp. (in: a-proteobacteria)]